MWVTVVLILIVMMIGEAVVVLSDKMPWNRKKYKKHENRWWENDQGK